MSLDRVMICLIGEQPVPNLLPMRRFNPNWVILVYSSVTEHVFLNLYKMLHNIHFVRGIKVENAYDITEIRQRIEQLLTDEGLNDAQLIVNFTGGTKPMSISAFRFAQDRDADAVYVESQAVRNKLYRYQFKGVQSLVEESEITDHLSIDEFLRAFGVAHYPAGQNKEDFEPLVGSVLRDYVDDLRANVNIGRNLVS